MIKTVYNIGYNTKGFYTKTTHLKIYSIWKEMLRRCYSELNQIRKPTYIGCTVDEKWHDFQIFSKWCEQNYIDGFQLDKDILFKANKLYSPETCCFVPNEINSLFLKHKENRGECPIGVRKNQSGNFQVSFNKNNKHQTFGTYKTIVEAFNVYKIEKEKHISEIANKWKDKISENVYQILINYEIKITD